MTRRPPRVAFRAAAGLAGVDAARVRALVGRAWELYAGPSGARLEVALLDDVAHTALHAEFLGDRASTDVMAFPYNDPDLYGEVVVNRDVAIAEGRARGGDPAREALLYVVHGALHLLGFRDHTDSARAEMRAAERRVLR